MQVLTDTVASGQLGAETGQARNLSISRRPSLAVEENGDCSERRLDGGISRGGVTDFADACPFLLAAGEVR